MIKSYTGEFIATQCKEVEYKERLHEYYSWKPQKPDRGAFNNIVKTSRKKKGVYEMLLKYDFAYGNRKNMVNKKYHGYRIGNCIIAEGEDPTCLMICDDAKIRVVKEKDIVWIL